MVIGCGANNHPEKQYAEVRSAKAVNVSRGTQYLCLRASVKENDVSGKAGRDRSPITLRTVNGPITFATNATPKSLTLRNRDRTEGHPLELGQPTLMHCKASLRHAAALALVGWYLMVPPTLSDSDSTCASNGWFSASDLIWALVARRWPAEVNSTRCDELEHQVDLDTPLSHWQEFGEFETLEACQAGLEKDRNDAWTQVESFRNLARVELNSEGQFDPPEEDLKLRTETIRRRFIAQAAKNRCIASDDPRLEK